MPAQPDYIEAIGSDETRHQFPKSWPMERVDAAMLNYERGLRSKGRVDTAVDMARSLPGGIAKGITAVAGLPGDLGDLSQAGFNYLANKMTGENIQTPRSRLSSSALNDYVSAPTGGFYEPKTGAGKYTETAASFLPAAFGGEASVLGRALGRVAAPAAGSMAAGSMVDEKENPVLHALAEAGGAVAGGLPSIVKEGARIGARKYIPKATEALAPTDAKLVAQAEALGLPLRPGQYNPSNFVRQGDAVLADSPWPRMTGFARDSQHAVLPRQQAEKFNSLLAKTFGQDADRITGEVVEKAHRDIGAVYDSVLPRNAIRDSAPLRTALDNVDEQLALASDALKPEDFTRVSKVMASIRGKVVTGMPGTLYQQFRARGGLLDELEQSGSPVIENAATAVRRALDDAFAAQASTADAAALKTANQQYRALKTLKPIIAKAPTGDLTPLAGQILPAVSREFGHAAKAGDLGTLAQIGAAYLKPLANSGTAERTVWRKLLNQPLSAGASMLNSAVSFPVSAVAGRQLNKFINSPQMRAKLLAEALQNPGATAMPTGPSGQALADLLRRQ